MSLKVRLAQDKPVGLVLPRITKCTVTDVIESTEGSDKKYIKTLSGVKVLLFCWFRLCVVKLQGGAKLTCSVALKKGDVINVDTEELTYQGRVKQAQA